MRKHPLIVVALVIVGGGFAATHANARGAAAASCNVRGVWRATRVTVNGKPNTTAAEVKIVTKNHFMWVNQENRRDTLPLRTFSDSMRVLNDAGGYGTYRVSGNSYVEHIDLFPDPSYIGKDWPATCRTTRNEWVHSWISPERADSTGRTRRDTVVEYYTRVE